MAKSRKTGRDAIALALSATLHLLVIGMVLNTTSHPYDLPEPQSPPMEAEIVPMQAVVIPPPPPEVPPPPKPAPPQKREIEPQPPKPAPSPPQPPKPQVPRTPPTAPPKPPTPQPAPPAKPAPATVAPTPKPSPLPAPTVTVAPTTPTPAVAPKPQPAAPAAPTALPSHLNLHKPAKKTPEGVPTLPLAPSPGPTGPSAPSAPTASGAPQAPGSRLNGLSPYPYGAMPSGGSGLRGTLVGCANADAVGLSREERARCAERFGMNAGEAPVLDPIPAGKRKAFDAIAAKQEADRKYREAVPIGTAPGKPGFGYGLTPVQP